MTSELFWLGSGEAAWLTSNWLILTRKWNVLLWMILIKPTFKSSFSLNFVLWVFWWFRYNHERNGHRILPHFHGMTVLLKTLPHFTKPNEGFTFYKTEFYKTHPNSPFFRAWRDKVNIIDGNECNRKIKLFPKVEHEQIFIGSLFEWNENMKGKKCFNQ